MLQQVNIRLPKDICARLDHISEKTGRTRSFYVKEAILEHLEELEDYYTVVDALKKSRKEKRYSLAEVEKMLGLDNRHQQKRAKATPKN